MSEKLAGGTAQRPLTATSETNPATALTPAERAEHELAKIDEEMDAILAPNPNQVALVNSPNQALTPAQGRSITPSVSAGVEANGVNHLAMNALVPGLGSLVRGHYATGAMQLGLAMASLPTLFMGKWFLAVLVALSAYLWSIISGIRFVSSPRNKTWR